MSWSVYAKQAVWEFLLVACVSTALGYTLLNGFYIEPGLQHSAVPGVVCVAATAALFALNRDSSTRFIGGIAFGVVVVGCLGAAAGLSGEYVTADVEGNWFLFLLLLLAQAIICFLLARTRTGCALLFAAGAFACALIQFFYERNELLWALLFVLAALMLVIYKNFQTSARGATSVRKVSFAAGFGVAAVAAAACALVASAVFFGIIAPLNPPAKQIKLVTEYRALETLPVQGTSSTFLTPNMDLTSDNTNSAERTTDDLRQSEDGRPMPAKPKGDASVEEEENSGGFMGVDLNSITRAFDFQTNQRQAWGLLLFLLLIPLAIAAYFVGRRLWRKRRVGRIRQLDETSQVRELYLFLVEHLARVGFAIPPGSTPLEFARNNAQSLERFDVEGQGSFEDLTRDYAKVVYGGQKADAAAADRAAKYYLGFWKAARKQLGNMRYLLKSFRL